MLGWFLLLGALSVLLGLVFVAHLKRGSRR